MPLYGYYNILIRENFFHILGINMDDIKIKILIAILSAIISGLGGYFSRESKVESLAKESERRHGQIVNLEKERNEIQSLYTSLGQKHSELQNSYNILYSKYQKCISADGAIYKVSSLDFNNDYKREFRTGDALEFGISAVPLGIKFSRITEMGPVIRIYGCEHYLTENEIISSYDGSNSHFIKTEYPFVIKYSAESCKKGNAYLPDNEIEVIHLKVLNYNVDEQTVNLQYYRTLL